MRHFRPPTFSPSSFCSSLYWRLLADTGKLRT
jgi:hypothetical protein